MEKNQDKGLIMMEVETQTDLKSKIQYLCGEFDGLVSKVLEPAFKDPQPLYKLRKKHYQEISDFAKRNGVNIPNWRIDCYLMMVYQLWRQKTLDGSVLERAISRGNQIVLLGEEIPEVSEPHILNPGKYHIPPGKEEFTHWLNEYKQNGKERN